MKYFRLCTPLDVEEIDRIESALGDGAAHPGEAKRRLAREIVSLYHSPEAAVEAERAFDRVFSMHEAPEDVPELALEPSDSVYLPAAMRRAGVARSTSEARRLIDGGGVRIDGEPVASGCYDLPFGPCRGPSAPSREAPLRAPSVARA